LAGLAFLFVDPENALVKTGDCVKRGGQIIAFDPWPVIRSINPDTEPEL
jgi:hypothetical protein